MVVKVNFGTFPFLYDIESYRNEIGKDSSVHPSVVRMMILDYLLCQG